MLWPKRSIHLPFCQSFPAPCCAYQWQNVNFIEQGWCWSYANEPFCFKGWQKCHCPITAWITHTKHVSKYDQFGIHFLNIKKKFLWRPNSTTYIVKNTWPAWIEMIRYYIKVSLPLKLCAQSSSNLSRQQHFNRSLPWVISQTPAI